jgi:hypothetical protein
LAERQPASALARPQLKVETSNIVNKAARLMADLRKFGRPMFRRAGSLEKPERLSSYLDTRKPRTSGDIGPCQILASL